ncbi:uncharacterized protein BX663DRAFT_559517 [Cokeromyces recurvatus]|uniref:uncharacterized protein n=1 Tax=Cokeromyces recurvatus TaxID=90255 RepID=UPI0022208E10|nr:uncharacterized protein BX663DRAFT_559517 [Cokeromyces recurvatus]KAI7905354.1 hypothetical protein BX663DRAFT_559517 [Cokeromyces recurvatus]
MDPYLYLVENGLLRDRNRVHVMVAIHTSTTENYSSQTIVNAEFPPLNGLASQNLDNSNSQVPWRNPNKVAALRQSMYLNRQKNRIRKEEAAARFFQPPSNNQGFQYLYMLYGLGQK